MTTCVATWSHSGYTLITDGQISSGNKVVKDNGCKVLNAGPHVKLAFAGSYWMHTQLELLLSGINTETLEDYFNTSRASKLPNADDLLADIEKFLFSNGGIVSYERESTITNALYCLWSIFVSLVQLQQLENESKDPEDNPYGCQLIALCPQGAYEITAEGNIIKSNFVVIGSGTQYAEGAVSGILSAKTIGIDSLSSRDAIIGNYDIEQQKELLEGVMTTVCQYDTDTNCNFSLMSFKK